MLLLTIFAVILQQIERQDTRWDHWFIAIAVPFGLFFLYAYLANIALFYKNARQTLHRAARAEVRRLCQQNRYAEARMHLRHIRNKHYLIAQVFRKNDKSNTSLTTMIQFVVTKGKDPRELH